MTIEPLLSLGIAGEILNELFVLDEKKLTTVQ